MVCFGFGGSLSCFSMVGVASASYGFSRPAFHNGIFVGAVFRWLCDESFK